jgi:hypothetical protein
MSLISRLVPTAILLGTVTAIAQPDPTPPATAPATTQSATTTFSAGEMRTRSAEILAAAQQDYSYVVALRERVRKLKDVIKLDCVNDRMVQLKAQLNIADHGNQSLQAALERDNAEANRLFSELNTTSLTIKELREQANHCVGEPELFKQEAGLEVTRPDLPDDPGVTDPVNPTGSVVVEPPGYASAYQ